LEAFYFGAFANKTYGEKGGYQMKMRMPIVVSASFIIVLGFLLTVPVHAQVGFVDWETTWFKGSIKDQGFIGDEFGIKKAKDKTRIYGYVQEWNDPFFIAYITEYDDILKSWKPPVPYYINVIAGTPLNFVAYGLVSPDDGVEGIELFAIILNIKGKEKNEAITKVSFKTVGACVIYNLGGEYFSAKETLSGKGVPAGKVPVEVIDVMASYLP
jgi:hypothetical protein